MRLSVFYKYLLSYILIFLIPVLILGVVIYMNAVSNLQKEIISANRNNLEQVKILIDQQYVSLMNTAVRIAIDPKLLPFRLQDGYEVRESIRELNGYKSNHPVVSELFVYYMGDDVMYSGAGYAALETVMSRQYQFADLTTTQFSEMVNNLSHAVVVPSQDVIVNSSENRRMLLYLFPIPVYNPNPYGVVITLVEERELTALIENMLGDFKGNMYIMNEQQDVLVSRTAGLTLSDSEWMNILERSDEEGISSLSVANQELSIVRTQSEQTGWSFAIVMPTEQFFNLVIERRVLVFALLALLSVSGVGMAVLLSKTHYKPIRKMIDSASSYWGGAGGEKRQDEWQWIGSSMKAAYESQMQLEHQIELQRPLVRDLFLQRWLKGELTDEREYAEGPVEIVEGDRFFVICLSMSRYTSKEKEIIWHLLAECLFTHGRGYGIELISDHNIALICQLDSLEADERQLIVDELLELLNREVNTPPIMGVGNLYSKTKVNRSFVEASAALEYKLASRPGIPIYFSAIEEGSDQSQWYPLQSQYRLVQSLRQGDASVALESLDEIIQHIRSREQSLLLLRYMTIDVINTILKIIDELKLKEGADYVRRLSEFQTLEDLESLLKPIIVDICSRIEDEKASNRQQLSTEILAYIEEHFRSNQLNLDEVAERFDLSVSHLSRFIKEQTGDTFTNFVIRLRVEEVKRQLVDTDLPIGEIVLNTGYTDISSFTRRFKKMEGVTPGQFRNQYRK